MRTIIAGSRTILRMSIVESVMKKAPIRPTVVLCGEAVGVDKLGAVWARKNGIPVESFPADWKKYGRSAGLMRNAQMAEQAEALIAIWDGKSRGAEHMINTAAKRNLPTFIYQLKPGIDGGQEV